MNRFYKFYCRAYHLCFKAAKPFMPYRDPEIVTSISDLPKALVQKGYRKALIVCGGTVSRLPVMSELKAALEAEDIAYAVYDRTVPNPTVSNAKEAAELYRASGCQAIIGLGGGSAIDCAKAVGALIARPKKPVAKMKGILKIRKEIPYLAAIPTTAGTGSEITLATVITDAERGDKFPISDFCLIPKIAVLDAEATLSMPASVTAATGMDALTHAVEAYIGISTTKATRRDAIDAVSLIFENLERAYADGSDIAAREKMLYASFLAGRAFSKSYVGYVHAIAHSLGGAYGISHGAANATLLPVVLKSYGSSVHRKLHKLAIAAGISRPEESDAEGAEKFIAEIEQMNSRMSISRCFAELREEDIPELARHAAAEANPLYPVPSLMNAEELSEIYFQFLEREP